MTMGIGIIRPVFAAVPGEGVLAAAWPAPRSGSGHGYVDVEAAPLHEAGEGRRGSAG